MENETLICRCEEVSMVCILNAIQTGAVTSKAIKLETRAGMGICQGRVCRPLLEQLIYNYADQSVSDNAETGSTHPVRPLRLNELAEMGEDADNANK